MRNLAIQLFMPSLSRSLPNKVLARIYKVLAGSINACVRRQRLKRQSRC